MQSFDFTTLMASCAELSTKWLPARLEKFYQTDRHTLLVALRTLEGRAWLCLSWHPQGARICLGNPPPSDLDTFTLSEQLRHQLGGFALTNIAMIAPWERVVDLQIAKRPGDLPLYHLYLEVMGKYSNLILTDANNQIITVAHQVNSSQSSVRTIQTGQRYSPPPPVLKKIPTQEFSLWKENIKLIPGTLQSQLLANYQGLSPLVAKTLIEKARLSPESLTEFLTDINWKNLYQQWILWLESIKTGKFQAGKTKKGYTVLGWQIVEKSTNVQSLLNDYYSSILKQEEFEKLRHQLKQKVNSLLEKIKSKAQAFQTRLAQAEDADIYQERANLLMAYLHQWQPGMQSISLPDFSTGQSIIIPLQADKNIIVNAQQLYKQNQKLKRVRQSVEPLLSEVLLELNYLENIFTSLEHLESYQSLDDLQTLAEIEQELIRQKYLITNRPPISKEESKPHRYLSPSGFDTIVGRNNSQNDQITFRLAGDYDLWFHSQQIPGSHVLLRLQPGSIAEEVDLQFAADLAAYFSQARGSEQVPIVYTPPKNVHKPKGSKPGMVVYKQEKVIWGNPHRVNKEIDKI